VAVESGEPRLGGLQLHLPGEELLAEGAGSLLCGGLGCASPRQFLLQAQSGLQEGLQPVLVSIQQLVRQRGGQGRPARRCRQQYLADEYFRLV
jgi:hypothetical protein